MNTRTAILRVTLLVLAGVVGTLLVLELMLQALPVGGRNIYAADPAAAWPVHHLVPDVEYVHSTDWNLLNVHRGHVNKQGYVAPFDYPIDGGGVALFGDSYVEGLMNLYRDTVQGRLPNLLRMRQPVMQFAVSGSSLPDYLGLAPLITAKYRPDWAVVVLVYGDFSGGYSADDGHFVWSTSDPALVRLLPVKPRSALQKQIRRLALLRYLRYNLKATVAGLMAPKHALTSSATATACTTTTLAEADVTLLAGAVRRLPSALGLAPGRVVLVFDSNRAALYAGHRASLDGDCGTREGLALTRLRSLAAEQGIHTIDTAPLFTRFYAATGRRVDYSPVDYHWNAEAHRLVAQELATIINAGARH